MSRRSTTVAVAAALVAGAMQACGGSAAIRGPDGGAGSGGSAAAGGGAGAGGSGGGSGGPGAACGANSACGGNIVGTWAITDDCNPQGMGMVTGFCAQAPLSVSGLHDSGTYMFNANGMFVVSQTITGTETVLYLPECLAEAGAPTCDDLNSIYALSVGPVYSSGSCASMASGCLCALGLDSALSLSGTYATSGSTVTLVPSGTTSSASGSYCVQGSTLTMTSMAMSTSGMSTTSTVVLTRTTGP